MNWGKWIVVAFILFAGFIATLVTVCIREDVNLVSKDYYQEELAYQQQIARINNTSKLAHLPVIQKRDDFIEVDFQHFSNIDNGVLHLFRPSDASMDKTFTLGHSPETKQHFPVADLKKGMYRARMQWAMEGKEYFIEQVINL